MRILYFSVHTVLEYDEIRIFQSLGHEVFPIGTQFGFDAPNAFRGGLKFSASEKSLLTEFYRLGCRYVNGDPNTSIVVTPEFVAMFDIVIFMHDLDLICRLWPSICHRPIVWRTIGQHIEPYELLAASPKAEGMHIVRYSRAERLAPNYCGETAVINFGKDPDEYPVWNGRNPSVLTFANRFAQRYPEDYASYVEMTNGISAVLGGDGNDDLPNSIGLVAPGLQSQLYQDSRAYLYCSGTSIPYTLNFIEALMTGMPMVAYDPQPPHPYYEVPDLLLEGNCALLAKNSVEGRSALQAILNDDELASKLSTNARRKALELFSFTTVAPQWETLLQEIVRRQ